MSTPDFFAIFDLPRSYALDPAVLEARYRDLSLRWHPDRQGKARPKERILALQKATDINEAYRVLRNDQLRAEHLLRLYGVDLSAEDGNKGKGGTQALVDPEFLMEILEEREALKEACHGQTKDPKAVQAIEANIKAHMAQGRSAIARAFADLDPKVHFDRLQSVVQLLFRQRYYQRFLDEIEAFYEDAHNTP